MTRKPAVSVLLPCYNASATLNEALESLASQSLEEFEIVAVDDGSTDETRDILLSWSEKDPRIATIFQPHSGIIPTLNSGLEACQADYVARMDADDRAHPERLKMQSRYLDEHPEITVAGCWVRGFPSEEVREGFRIYIEWQNSLIGDEDIRREIFIESPLAHPSVMLRKNQVQTIGGYQEHGWPEDYDLWLRLYINQARFGKVPEVLLEWRESPERLTRRDSRYSLENFLRAKAQYLASGPLQNKETILIWGAGMMGRRLGKQIERTGCKITAFIDIDPKKIGSTRRGKPVISPEQLMGLWRNSPEPVLLAAVGARGARKLIRERLVALGLVEGKDWWFAA
jgi:cellulose synthase/poly-beta-1,6-N-acetylglucosamine synthase-like glycosyltransferase